MTTRLVIPADIEFEHLNVRREPDGSVTFDHEVVEAILDASDISEEPTEDEVSGLIVQWYVFHRSHGGEPNAVMEDLLKETRLEDERRQNTSHRPGRA